MTTSSKFSIVFQIALAFLIVLLSCSKDNGTNPGESSDITPIELNFEDPPIDLQGNDAQFT